MLNSQQVSSTKSAEEPNLGTIHNVPRKVIVRTAKSISTNNKFVHEMEKKHHHEALFGSSRLPAPLARANRVLLLAG